MTQCPTERLNAWVNKSNQLAQNLESLRRSDAERYTGEVSRDSRALIDSLRTRGEPLVRVVAALMPGGQR